MKVTYRADWASAVNCKLRKGGGILTRKEQAAESAIDPPSDDKVRSEHVIISNESDDEEEDKEEDDPSGLVKKSGLPKSIVKSCWAGGSLGGDGSNVCAKTLKSLPKISPKWLAVAIGWGWGFELLFRLFCSSKTCAKMLLWWRVASNLAVSSCTWYWSCRCLPKEIY